MNRTIPVLEIAGETPKTPAAGKTSPLARISQPLPRPPGRPTLTLPGQSAELPAVFKAWIHEESEYEILGEYHREKKG